MDKPLQRYWRDVHVGHAHAIHVPGTSYHASALSSLGIDPPEVVKGYTQFPVEGVSFGATFDDPEGKTGKQTQFYSMGGTRAIWHQGWKAAAISNSAPDNQDIEDDRLRLIFTCCHPALADATQVALTLREVCDLTTEQIASAFLTSPATVAQRIVRGVEPQGLRDSDALRQRVASDLARVGSSLDDLLVDRPRRRIVRNAVIRGAS